MRYLTSAVFLLAIIPSQLHGDEPAPRASAPSAKKESLVQEVTGSGPSERLIHLKAALAHLERAGIEDPKVAQAAEIIGNLIDAEKSDEAVVGAFQAVDVQIAVYEVNVVKLRNVGLDWANFEKLEGQGDQQADFLKSLAKNGLAKVLSEPRIQTLSGREATLEVGNDAQKLTAKILPTVLKGNKIRVDIECELSRTPPPQGADGPAAKPLTKRRGLKSMLEVAAGKSVILSRSHDVTRRGGKVEETDLIFVMTPSFAIAREAKAPTNRPNSEPNSTR